MSFDIPISCKDFVRTELIYQYDSYKNYYEETVDSLSSIDIEHLANQAQKLKDLAERSLALYERTDAKTEPFCQEFLEQLTTISLSKKDATDKTKVTCILMYVRGLQRCCEEIEELESEKETLDTDARLLWGQFNAYFNSKKHPDDLHDLRMRIKSCLDDSDLGLKPLLHFAKLIFGVTYLEGYHDWISSMRITIYSKATAILHSIHRPIDEALRIKSSLETDIKAKLYHLS